MSMTKKDFQVIAAAIASLPDTVSQKRNHAWTLNIIALHFADALAPLNPRFKRDLFVQAATGQVSVTARKVREVTP